MADSTIGERQALSITERVSIAKAHLFGANLFGVALIAGLFWLAYSTQDRLGIMMALVAGVSGYLSQLAGANWLWGGVEVWHGVMTGLILTAAAAWVLGILSYLV